jgi:hypothetical protein
MSYTQIQTHTSTNRPITLALSVKRFRKPNRNHADSYQALCLREAEDKGRAVEGAAIVGLRIN